MQYFIADTHIGHNRDFIYKQRGFNTIEAHDEALLDGINYTVRQTDTLYLLGDVAWVDPVKFLNSIWCQNIYIIKGNHDDELYSLNQQKKFINATLLGEIADIKINGNKITLSHFPLISWQSSHYNALNIHGHVHGKKLPIKGKQIDVCPKETHIQPYSFDELYSIYLTLPDNWDFIRDN